MKKPSLDSIQPSLPEDRPTKTRIPHLAILARIQGPLESKTNLAGIYRRQVLTVRTRTIALPGMKSPARVIKTLLGYEVQARHQRIHCPDLVTAHYLKLFTEIGCRSIKLPYDPTVTAAILPSLDSALNNIIRFAREAYGANPQFQAYALRRFFHHLRRQLWVPHFENQGKISR